MFPTLADEWGLVPVEAMASGLVVLGSRFAQSIEELSVDGKNGWSFSPLDRQETWDMIDKAFNTSPEQLNVMSRFARQSVRHITPEQASEKFCQVIQTVLNPATRQGTAVTKPINSHVI